MQKTIVITGGTGLVGNRLSRLLAQKGYRVRHLSRRRNLNAVFPAYYWNYETNEIDDDALDGANYVLHLAGANVAGSLWTKKYKQEINDSRTKTTQLLQGLIQQKNLKLDAFIAASATGFYGETGSETVDETSQCGTTYLADVCRNWENSVQKIADLGIRTAYLRIGIVLSTQGGALQKLLPTYSLGVGSYFGNGAMFTSWIHLDDLCYLFIEAMENENYTGVYNAVAPAPTTSKELGKAVAIACNKPNALLIGAPSFALRLAMGEMSDILLGNNRVVPTRTAAHGFQWKYPDLVIAIADLIKNKI